MMVPCHQEVHSQAGPEVVQDRQHMEIKMVNSVLVDNKIFEQRHLKISAKIQLNLIRNF